MFYTGLRRDGTGIKRVGGEGGSVVFFIHTVAASGTASPGKSAIKEIKGRLRQLGVSEDVISQCVEKRDLHALLDQALGRAQGTVSGGILHPSLMSSGNSSSGPAPTSRGSAAASLNFGGDVSAGSGVTCLPSASGVSVPSSGSAAQKDEGSGEVKSSKEEVALNFSDNVKITCKLVRHLIVVCDCCLAVQCFVFGRRHATDCA